MDEVDGRDTPQPDHFRFLFDPRQTLTLLAGHRRRFGNAVAALTSEELAAPSRCAGWTVGDVLRHGIWADGALRRIWSGDRSMSKGFDPRTTPDEFVRAERAVADEDIRERYLSSTDTMIAELSDAGTERFGVPSWSPAGRVPWWISAVHVGWDSTVHERDILTPLGRSVEVPADEAATALAYVLVLASFLGGREVLDATIGPVQLRVGTGPTTVRAAGPDATDDDTVIVCTGDPAALTDALTGRGQLVDVLVGPPGVAQRLNGLATFFTTAP